jgi:hypothetical protein
MAHGFYASMGGFAIEIPGLGSEKSFIPNSVKERWTLTSTAMLYLASLPEAIIWTPDVLIEEIRDKSKADVIVQSMVAMQISWFCVQFVSRVLLSLPVATLEINAIFYIICAVLTCILWWDKPLDVQTPTLVRGESFWPLRAIMWMSHSPTSHWKTDPDIDLLSERMQHNVFDEKETGLYQYAEGDFIECSTPHIDGRCLLAAEEFQNFDSLSDSTATLRPGEVLAGTGFRVGSSMPINRFLGIWRPPHHPVADIKLDPIDVRRWRLAWQAYANTAHMSFEERRKYLNDSLVVRCKNWPPFGWDIYTEESFDFFRLLLFALPSLIFGAVNELAWVLELLSDMALCLWCVLGPSAWLSSLISAYFRPLERRFWKSTSPYTMALGISNVILVIYVIARGFIVVESFMSLRSMPTGVYERVNWDALLPHL